MENAPPKKLVPDFVGVTAEPSHVGDGVWFGPADRPLFGWYHAPKAVIRSCGVVLCPPFGHEYMVSYRAYRKLATMLVEAGFAVFRFDYDATGDAAGDAWEPRRVEGWQASIRAATEELRQRSGLKQIALFGVRLGALLAASVADLESADALVLMAPVVSGRLYVRELLAFRNMNAAAKGLAPGEGAKSDGQEEVAGYALSEETRNALGQLDFTKLNGLVAPAALILARDDVPSGEGRIVTSLTKLGTQTELHTGAGYGAMMPDDAYDSQVPEELWGTVTSWLSKRYPVVPVAPAPRVPHRHVATFVSGTKKIREELITVAGSVGILTESAIGPPDLNRPAIIISNTGANHRVGNHRLCVTMARNWAARGYCIVRFDRPGIGDSAAVPNGKENAVYAPEGVTSVRTVMDHLAHSRGYSRFILAGLCSGAYFSFHTAIRDPRVVGLLMINPLTYDWRDGTENPASQPKIFKSTDFYVRAATNPQTWRRLVTGEINATEIAGALLRRANSKAKVTYAEVLAKAARRELSVTPTGRAFLDLAARGVQTLMIFDADEGGIDLMHEHLRPNAELMRSSSNFRLEIVKDTDHTFTPIWAQIQISDLVGDHWQARFG